MLLGKSRQEDEDNLRKKDNRETRLQLENVIIIMILIDLLYYTSHLRTMKHP